jgi:aldehyde:ferredoxin oxidoreductase
VPQFGDILDIDLTTGASARTPLGEAAVRSILGGRGYGVLELLRKTDGDTDPLGPANPLILAAGLLTGSGVPSASRVQVTARSPLTGLLGSSNIGGGFGFAMHAAGIAALVLRGRAPRFSALTIARDGVELLDARGLAGLESSVAQAALAELVPGGQGEALVIGPAGERLLPLACMVARRGHAAGRTGLGAVLGAKNLKGIVAATDADATPVRTGEPARLARSYVRQIVAATSYKEFFDFGSTAGVEWGNERGLLSTRNFTTGRSAAAAAVDSAHIHQFFQQRSGCRHCPVQCKAEVRIAVAGMADTLGNRPDFEPLVSWGPRLGIDDPAAVVRLHNRCDELGLDSISAGGAVAFAIDIFERGIITTADTGGFELRWGDAEAAGRLLEGMATGEGFAGLLAHGVRQAALEIGRGSHRYAYHVKGLELCSFDPRGAWGTALGYVVSSRGGDYSSVYAHHEFDPPPAATKSFYGGGESANPLLPAGKAALVRRSLIVSAVVDALGLCKVPVLSLLNRFDLELEAELTEAFAGLSLSADELWAAGERIVTLERLYNLRCGAKADDDRLPTRFTERNLNSLPGGGMVELHELRHELYTLMGWTAEGVPTPQKLDELGLRDLLPPEGEEPAVR